MVEFLVWVDVWEEERVDPEVLEEASEPVQD
jgi:hypothetical protein